jgi:hypothetical protein
MLDLRTRLAASTPRASPPLVEDLRITTSALGVSMERAEMKQPALVAGCKSRLSVY